MSVSFSGSKTDPTAPYGSRSVRLKCEPDAYGNDERDFNLANANARLFLALLDLPYEDNDDLYGSRSVVEMVKAVQSARANFDYRVDALCRPDESGRGAGGCRYFSQGVDVDYFTRRLAQFEEHLADLILAGADTINWG